MSMYKYCTSWKDVENSFPGLLLSMSQKGFHHSCNVTSTSQFNIKVWQVAWCHFLCHFCHWGSFSRCISTPGVGSVHHVQRYPIAYVLLKLSCWCYSITCAIFITKHISCSSKHTEVYGLEYMNTSWLQDLNQFLQEKLFSCVHVV